jgi:hypothetical protein
VIAEQGGAALWSGGRRARRTGETPVSPSFINPANPLKQTSEITMVNPACKMFLP